MEDKNKIYIPDLGVSCKLGSLVVHLQEAMSSKAHKFDTLAIQSILNDKDVNQWLKEMDKLALIPKKR